MTYLILRDRSRARLFTLSLMGTRRSRCSYNAAAVHARAFPRAFRGMDAREPASKRADVTIPRPPRDPTRRRLQSSPPPASHPAGGEARKYSGYRDSGDGTAGKSGAKTGVP